MTFNGEAHTYTSKGSLLERHQFLVANHCADSNDLVIQRTKLKFGQRAFSVAGPRIWNQLPTELETTIDTATVKRKLKT